jgi:uncharacterized membrane protein
VGALAIQGEVFWPYFAGAVVTATGAVGMRSAVSAARSRDWIALLGPPFFAIPMAVFGAEHFVSAKDIMQMVPKWMPGHLFWTYFVGIALFCAAISMTLKQKMAWSAPLTGLMFFLFVVLLHLPGALSDPKNRTAWEVLFRDLSFSGGALAFGGAVAQDWPPLARKIVTRTGQIFFAVTTIFFGVEQLIHPEHVPGVPLERVTPAWIPGHVLWSYFCGIVFVPAGICLLVNRKTRLAATSVAVLIILVLLFVYLPLWGASLPDISLGLNYFADTLMFCGAALLLAQAMPKETPSHV